MSEDDTWGSCCFCGDRCNPMSQSCGTCFRQIHTTRSGCPTPMSVIIPPTSATATTATTAFVEDDGYANNIRKLRYTNMSRAELIRRIEYLEQQLQNKKLQLKKCNKRSKK